jgi:hypothetical protein
LRASGSDSHPTMPIPARFHIGGKQKPLYHCYIVA